MKPVSAPLVDDEQFSGLTVKLPFEYIASRSSKSLQTNPNHSVQSKSI